MSKLIYDLDFRDYQESEGLNHSSLKNLYPPNTPLDFWWHKHHPRKPTDSQNFGSAAHIAVFEHERFDDAIVIAPQCDRRTKAGKEEYNAFLDTASGKIILTQEELDSCFYIIEACQNHEILKDYLADKNAKYEVSGYFDYKDVPLKFRTDYMNPEIKLILDLKTTKAGHKRSFQRSVLDFCYHSQAAFYLLGMQEITGETWSDFLWITIESGAPHKIYIWEPDTSWLIHAMNLIDNALDVYKECIRTNSYPGVPAEINTLEIPHFLLGEI